VDLTILLLSCRRLGLLEQTVAATRRHFEAVEPEVAVRWVCFDNGSSPEDQRRLEALGFDHLLLSKTNLGQGPALNQLLAAVRTDHFLLLEDDWLLENPRLVPFVREAVTILASDGRIGQVKLDALHRTDFTDRVTYDGPFRAEHGSISFFVQNPAVQWGGFTCPPAITRTDAVRRAGAFREDEPFRKWWAESEYSARTARHFVTAKSPDMLLYRHIGDEPSTGWHDASAPVRVIARAPSPPRPQIDPYGTHFPLLAAACAASKGPILELGCGTWSTPMLHEIAKATGRRLVSLETDPEWLATFDDFRTDWHELRHVPGGGPMGEGAAWDDVPLEKTEWGVVFVDHRPGDRRRVEIERLRGRAEFLVVHDTEDPSYGYESLLSTFGWRHDFTRFRPWTTVVSDVARFPACAT
jgi:hypothetical protein